MTEKSASCITRKAKNNEIHLFGISVRAIELSGFDRKWSSSVSRVLAPEEQHVYSSDPDLSRSVGAACNEHAKAT